MKVFRVLTTLTAVALLLAMAACTTDESQQADVAGEVQPQDTAIDTAGPDIQGYTGHIEPVNQTRQMTYSTADFLEAIYTVGGAPVAGVSLQFDLMETPNNVAVITTPVAETDQTGKARAKISVGSVATTFQVKVFDTGGTAEPKYFQITLVAKSEAALQVNFEYNGFRDKTVIEWVDVRVFRQEGDTAIRCTNFVSSIPSCGNGACELGTEQASSCPQDCATTTEPVKTAPVEGKAEWPSLANGTYTVWAEGHMKAENAEGNEGPIIVTGCNDTDGVITEGAPAFVTVVLNDIWPQVTGTYTITHEFDLISALKNSGNPTLITVYQVVVNIFGFFNNPSGTLLALTCVFAESNDTLKSICTTLFDPIYDAEGNIIDCKRDDGGSPVSTSTWGAMAIAVVNAILNSLIEGTFLEDIMDIGGSIGMLVQDLTISGVFVISAQPDAAGHIAKDKAYQEWHTIHYKWKTDGAETIEGSFSTTQLTGSSFLKGNFESNITYNKEKKRFEIAILPHYLDLKYGLLIAFVIEKIVLKKFAGVDNFEDFMKILVGGKDCLTDTSKTCCEAFAEGVDDPGSSIYNMVKAGCDALLPMAAQYLRKTLTDLDVATATDCASGGFCLSTPVDKPCHLKEEAKMIMEGGTRVSRYIISWFGSNEDKCEWDAMIKIKETVVDFDAQFFGPNEIVEQ